MGRATVARLRASGELDTTTLARLDFELRRAQVASAVVVLDLRGCDDIDSVGIEMIRAAHHRARRAGELFLVVCQAEVKWYLELVGVECRRELSEPRLAAAAARPHENAAA